jgi:hypothetical protein
MSPWNCTMLMYWKTDSVGVFCVFVFLCFCVLVFCVFVFLVFFCVFVFFCILGWDGNSIVVGTLGVYQWKFPPGK